MHHTERRIAVRNRIDYNSDCEQVINFVKALVLSKHLFKYTVEMLCSARHLTFYIILFKLFFTA